MFKDISDTFLLSKCLYHVCITGTGTPENGGNKPFPEAYSDSNAGTRVDALEEYVWQGTVMMRMI